MHLKNKESLKARLINLKNPVKPKNLDKEQKKSLNFENAHRLFTARQKVLNGFEHRIFLIKY